MSKLCLWNFVVSFFIKFVKFFLLFLGMVLKLILIFEKWFFLIWFIKLLINFVFILFEEFSNLWISLLLGLEVFLV